MSDCKPHTIRLGIPLFYFGSAYTQIYFSLGKKVVTYTYNYRTVRLQFINVTSYRISLRNFGNFRKTLDIYRIETLKLFDS